ncbi:uncharacterized protein [Battus philenor]|uniref:uncharacterized protein n=1 Tax=Battus philenor TaxID=42288 RepID=UPI0035CEB7A0
MRKKYNTLFILLIAVACLTPVFSKTLPDEIEKVEEKSDDISKLESKKSEESLAEDKNGGETHDSTETRMERSPENVSDEKTGSDEVKTGNPDHEISKENTNLRRSSPVNEDQKSIETITNDDERSSSNFDKDTDDLDFVRSATNLNEEELDDKTATDDFSNKNDNINEDIHEKSSEIEMNTSRSEPHDTRDALLDSKARSAESSAEHLANPENNVLSKLGIKNAENLIGSRRSFSDNSPSAFGDTTLGRSSNIFNEAPSPIEEKSLQYTKIPTSEIIHPKPFINPPPLTPPPPPVFNDYKPPNMLQRPNNPFNFPESKPFKDYDLNPFTNSYPYAQNLVPNPSTTQNPIEISRPRNPSTIFPKLPQISGVYPPKFTPESLQTFYPPFKPVESNLPLPVLNPYMIRYNRFTNPPYQNRQKCSSCFP